MVDLTTSLHTLIGKYGLVTKSGKVVVNKELTKNLFLSPLLANECFCGNLPIELINFLDTYFKTLDNNEKIVLNNIDIDTSEFTVLFKTYLSCLERFFHEFCLLHGLNFYDYFLDTDITFYPNFTQYSFEYSKQYINFFFITFLSDKSPKISLGVNKDVEISLGKGLPMIVPNVYSSLLEVEEAVPAIIVNIKGA